MTPIIEAFVASCIDPVRKNLMSKENDNYERFLKSIQEDKEQDEIIQRIKSSCSSTTRELIMQKLIDDDSAEYRNEKLVYKSFSHRKFNSKYLLVQIVLSEEFHNLGFPQNYFGTVRKSALQFLRRLVLSIETMFFGENEKKKKSNILKKKKDPDEKTNMNKNNNNSSKKNSKNIDNNYDIHSTSSFETNENDVEAKGTSISSSRKRSLEQFGLTNDDLDIEDDELGMDDITPVKNHLANFEQSMLQNPTDLSCDIMFSFRQT